MNKFVLRFSGSATEYAGVLSPDNVPDNHNYVNIKDATRPITARMFMSDAQYNALPANFKEQDIDQTDGLCAIQITTNAFDKDTPEANPTEKTLQTSYCFMLVSAQPVSAGIDTDIREIKLATTQILWSKSPVFCAFNTRSDYTVYPSSTADVTALETAGSRTLVFQDVWDKINTTLRYGIVKTDLPTLPDNTHDTSIFMPPVNFVCQHEPADKALRRLLDPCGYTMVLTPWLSALGATTKNQLAIFNLGATDNNVAKVEALATKARANGCKDGSVDEDWGNWNTPGTVRFIFQKTSPASVETSAGVIITNDTATTDSTNANGKSWVVLPVYANEYKSGDAFTRWKGQTLKAIAGRTSIKPRRFMLVGAYPFAPGAQFRTVEVVYDKQGVYTILTQHGYIEPEGKREYGISINPEDFNIVSASGVVLDRRADGTIDMIGGGGGGGGDTDPNVYYKVHAEYTAGTSNNPADVDYCNSAGTTTGSTGSETIVTLPFGTVIATTNVIVKGETPTKLTSDVQWDTPYLKKRFRYQFQKFATAEGAWTTFATATTYP